MGFFKQHECAYNVVILGAKDCLQLGVKSAGAYRPIVLIAKFRIIAAASKLLVA